LKFKDPISQSKIKCKILDLLYFLPSATTYEMNRKLEIDDNEYCILTELDVEILEPESLKGKEFTILYFNSEISANYVIPTPKMQEADELNVENIIGNKIMPINVNDSPKDIIDVNDYEPEVYINSPFKEICYKQEVFNKDPDGYSFRTNVYGRNTLYQIGRLSRWEIRK
jgi:hypothetical protein